MVRVLVMALALLLAFPLGDVPGDIVAEVVKVSDGDTIRILWDGQDYPVRYIGVDTPEVYFGLQCYGREASQANKDMVKRQLVRLL